MLRLSTFLSASVFVTVALATSAANAACPQELAVYEADNGNLLEFTGNSDASMKFHQIKIVLQGNDDDAPIMLDAFVEKTHGLQQPEMKIQYGCPDGDFTDEDLEACTIYQSVIYGADKSGILNELPVAGDDAAQSIVLPNFTADVWMHEAWTDTGGPKRPAELFQLSGCME